MIIESVIGALELMMLVVLGVTAYSTVTTMIQTMNRELSVTDREDAVRARELSLSFEIQSRLAEEFQKGWSSRDSA